MKELLAQSEFVAAIAASLFTVFGAAGLVPKRGAARAAGSRC